MNENNYNFSKVNSYKKLNNNISNNKSNSLFKKGNRSFLGVNPNSNTNASNNIDDDLSKNIDNDTLDDDTLGDNNTSGGIKNALKKLKIVLGVSKILTLIISIIIALLPILLVLFFITILITPILHYFNGS